MARILIISNRQRIKVQLAQFLEELPHDIEACGFNDERATLKDGPAPDMLLLHLESCGSQLQSYLKMLHREHKSVKTVMLSDVPNFKIGRELLALDIYGYGNINMSASSLKQLVDIVLAGNIWLYPEFIQKLVTLSNLQDNEDSSDDDLLDMLSQREREVALLAAKGLSNREISEQIDTTERTVKAHLSSIFQKLGIKDRLSLALKLKK